MRNDSFFQSIIVSFVLLALAFGVIQFQLYKAERRIIAIEITQKELIRLLGETSAELKDHKAMVHYGKRVVKKKRRFPKP